MKEIELPILSEEDSAEKVVEDISELADLFYEMLSGSRSYSETNRIRALPKEQFLNENRGSSSLSLSRQGKDILWSLNQTNDANRLTADQIVCHAWFSTPGLDPEFEDVKASGILSGSNDESDESSSDSTS